jgi:N-acetylmuramoyl-L-alanine amidase
MRSRYFFIFVLVILSAYCAFAHAASGPFRIKAVSYQSSPEATRVVLEVSGNIPYKFFVLTDPDRLVVDFKNTVTSFPHAPIEVKDGILDNIRFGEFDADVFRMVFDLSQPAQARIKTSESSAGKADRLVIELALPHPKTPETKPVPTKAPVKPKDKKIIVIDPGHGGEDPGAIGPGKAREKDIVLAFGRCLKRWFDEKGEYHALLTREGDYFLPLRERVKFAENHQADLFISVHADSNRKKNMRGASVYCLSLQGASDEATRYLAEKENASDQFSRVPLTENEDLNATLLDLALTDNINSSLRFGAMVLREMSAVQAIKFETPRQAGFRVLKTTGMPAVLIEIGFLSNPAEERTLAKQGFQNNVAQAIVTASGQFLEAVAKTDSGHPAMANLQAQGDSDEFSE